jgi:menaquinone-specific isochorismate synthase
MIMEPSAGVFLGATPETLVHIEGKKIATHALAGTMPAVAYSESHLLENAKNHLEHKIVVQSILKRLGLHGAHSIKEKGLRVVRLPHVLHLETEILAEQVQAGRLLHWVKHLHPTPAVGGFPDDRALAYLREHEFCDRSLYASPLGWVNRYNEGTFSVALRSGFINKTCREAYAYAGVGIVAGSEPVSEWEEIALKLRTLCQALWTLADEGDVD